MTAAVAKKSSTPPTTTMEKKSKSESGTTSNASASASARATKAAVASTTKKRAVKSSSASAAAAPTAAAPAAVEKAEEKVPTSSATAATRTRTTKTKTVKAEVLEEPDVVQVGTTKTEAAADKVASPAQAASPATTPAQVKKQQQSTSAPEIQPSPPLQNVKVEVELELEKVQIQVSEILLQARAFAKKPPSEEPKKSVRRRQGVDRKTESTDGPPHLTTTDVDNAAAAIGHANLANEIPPPFEIAHASLTTPPSSSSNYPTKLLTTNPLYTSTRPKYTLPYSTTTALASRQQEQKQQKLQSQSQSQPQPTRRPPSGLRSSRPPPTLTSTTTPGQSEKPEPPMPVEELRRTPRYRKLNARVRRIMVALPIAIVTSYYLYQRRDEQRIYEEGLQALGRGAGGAGHAGAGFGFGAESPRGNAAVTSDVGAVNGGTAAAPGQNDQQR